MANNVIAACISNKSTSSQASQERAGFLLSCGNLDSLQYRFEDAEHLVEGLNRFHDCDPNDPGNEPNALASRFHTVIREAAQDRTFLATDTGHMGSGPKLARKGDVAFIMPGGRYVHILRPVDNYYLYVGAAYVYGMMEGEVFDLGLEPEWVNIR
ncbi:hypothetical protein CLAFUW4_05184 [Fulvia fulva]|uniref:Uncharacterized protein n=1 Tax=Passalora fulva TaxID=5499 RepID=A0A9Q8UUM4_PASFU|nr:uncharacterized protein CLAFUR5_11722 [Fulvia fulva]KAK4626570.1 hypothetical protein CLAFUR4_05170 [Fulvia fulva]KAK4627550.1 hypothetical protein CLAFUR0_05176 [Fulvia fulva]UJO23081.1 hypothetical protein CLAFUR5_11722 [Fulvia fulva]WPV13961.1 hypothetical protein CLAFUW4_05184 [Fulvia fulva]WPV28467.1 hypothetical protein CLAFUW7_05180 [Fulvia fulva]